MHDITNSYGHNRRQRLRLRSPPRPLPPQRPQNNVPNHLLLHRRRPSSLLRPQDAPQQQTPLHPAERDEKRESESGERYQGGHDGDLPDRYEWWAEGDEEIDGMSALSILGVC